MNKSICIPVAISIAAILWAFNPDNPYGYYILLRFILCGTFSWFCFQAIKQEIQPGFIWVSGITALIYNPFIRFGLGRTIWTFVNIATIFMLIFSLFKLGRVKK